VTHDQLEEENLSAWRALTEVGELGAACNPRERLGGDENSAMIIDRAFSVVSVTRNLFNQFAIRLEKQSHLYRKDERARHDLAVPRAAPNVWLVSQPRSRHKAKQSSVTETYGSVRAKSP
jgi:hypothetical protein